MNEDVLDMIDTLHARLNDVCEEVKGLAVPIPEYVKRLDGIDDQLYAVQCELEKCAHRVSEDTRPAWDEGGASAGGTPAPATSSSVETSEKRVESCEQEGASQNEGAPATQSSKSSSEKKEILTDEMKENLADAGRAVGHVLRDSKEVVSELSGTVNEIKDLFSFKPGKKH